MFGSIPPEKVNQSGARWNPEDVAAIYCSLQPQTAVAEIDFHISLQPFRPKSERRVHRIEVSIPSVVDLSDWQTLERLGLDLASFADVEPAGCKEIGGAISFLGHGGAIVPSARCDGLNLVIYPTAELIFKPLDFVVVPY